MAISRLYIRNLKKKTEWNNENETKVLLDTRLYESVSVNMCIICIWMNRWTFWIKKKVFINICHRQKKTVYKKQSSKTKTTYRKKTQQWGNTYGQWTCI